MKKSVRFLICLSIFVMLLFLCSCSNGNEKKYSEAVDAVLNDNIEYAKQLFSELPGDYKPENSACTPEHWLYGIERYYDSAFIGDWEGNGYKLHIGRIESETMGVYLSFNRDYTSPSGVKVGDFGTLNIYDDEVTADFTSSSSNYGGTSNSKYYKIKMIDKNTINLYFKNEIETTLYRK